MLVVIEHGRGTAEHFGIDPSEVDVITGTLGKGVFVMGFGYPVVPEGTARIRAQISAGLGPQQVDAAAGAFSEVLTS